MLPTIEEMMFKREDGTDRKRKREDGGVPVKCVERECKRAAEELSYGEIYDAEVNAANARNAAGERTKSGQKWPTPKEKSHFHCPNEGCAYRYDKYMLKSGDMTNHIAKCCS